MMCNFCTGGQKYNEVTEVVSIVEWVTTLKWLVGSGMVSKSTYKAATIGS